MRITLLSALLLSVTGAVAPARDAQTVSHTAPSTVLAYSTFIGGSGAEFLRGVAVDGTGNVYVAGITYSRDYPTTRGAFQRRFAGNTTNTPDVVVAKFDPSGKLVYSTYIGSNYSDYAIAVAADANGNVYVVGSTDSPGFPTTPGSLHPTTPGGPNSFLAKLSPDGTRLVFSTFLGASIEPDGVAVDESDAVYLVGATQDPDFPATPGAFQPVCGNGPGADRIFDAAVMKINPEGNAVVYASFLGGPARDGAYDVAVDGSGRAFVVGHTDGDFPTTLGAAQVAPGGVRDGFVAAVSADGSRLEYASYLGGAAKDSASEVAVDASGVAYVTGTTRSPDLPVTDGAVARSFAGGGVDDEVTQELSGDAFVAKVAPDGRSFDYFTYLGGAGGETGEAVAVDQFGSAYVTGSAGAGFPTTQDAFQRTTRAQFPSFVAKLSPSGDALAYATYLTGGDDAAAFDIAVDGAGNAFVIGETQSRNFPTTGRAQQPTIGGLADGFLSELAIPGPPAFAIRVDPRSLTVSRGERGEIVVKVDRFAPFVGPITVVAPAPGDTNVKFTPQASAADGTSATLAYKVKRSASVGMYELVIVGRDANGREATAVLEVTVR